MELPNSFPGCQITNFTQHAQTLTLQTISTAHQAACPKCGTISQRVHGYYTRRPKDLPWTAHAVQLELHVIRYRCLNPTCSTVTFAERFPAWLPVKAQRTSRLQQAHAQLGLHISAAGVIGLLDELQIPTSDDTVLRSIKQLALPEHATPRVLGVDDWAFRQGKRYGTILVDLEQHCVVDLLPERSTEALAAWLESHPGIEVVTRDRASEYSRAINQAAPKAEQVADRFHLLQNLIFCVQAWLERKKKTVFEGLHKLQPSKTSSREPPELVTPNLSGSSKQRHQRQSERAERVKQYNTVKKLRAEGTGVVEISRIMNVPISTIRFWLKQDEFQVRLGRPSKLSDEEETHIKTRWAEGVSNAAKLHRELLNQGYTGSVGPVIWFLGFLRSGEPLEQTRSETKSSKSKLRLPNTIREITHVLVTPESRLNEAKQKFLKGLLENNSELHGYRLIQEFRGLFLK
jgi:transposase